MARIGSRVASIKKRIRILYGRLLVLAILLLILDITFVFVRTYLKRKRQDISFCASFYLRYSIIVTKHDLKIASVLACSIFCEMQH